MVDKTAVPMLSPSGWTSSPSEKADALMSHFFEAEKSQTAIYGDNVCSLQWLVATYGHQPNTLANKMQSALETYLTKYFDMATAAISTDDVPENITGKINVTMHITVVANGTKYSLGRLLQVSNSKIEKIIKLNNAG